jgi:hypothetical protein
MRTDGLNAFDAATRLELEALIRPRQRVREKRQREHKIRVKAVKQPSKPRPIGKTTQAAHLWIAYEAATPKRKRMTKTAFAKLHGVKMGSFSSALYYATHPDAHRKKYDRLNQKARDLRAQIARERANTPAP